MHNFWENGFQKYVCVFNSWIMITIYFFFFFYQTVGEYEVYVNEWSFSWKQKTVDISLVKNDLKYNTFLWQKLPT